MEKENRFEEHTVKGDSPALGVVNKIIVDKETGIEYLYHKAGYGGGLVMLVDRDGKPKIASQVLKED